MYLGLSLEWQQTTEARRARLAYAAREVACAVVFSGVAIPAIVYLLLEAIP